MNRRTPGLAVPLLYALLHAPAPAQAPAARSDPQAAFAEIEAGVAACPPGSPRAAWCAELLLDAASAAVALDRPREAEAFARRALVFALASSGADGIAAAWSHRAIGDGLLEQHRPAEAQPHYQASLDIFLARLGERDAITAGAYNALARSLMAQMAPERALPYLRRSADILVAARGEVDHDVAVAFRNVAGAMLAIEGPDDAQTLFDRAVAIERQLGNGAETDNLADAVHDLGWYFASHGQAAQALRHYEEALGIRRRLHGEDDVRTARSHSTIGGVLIDDRRFEEAGESYRRALASRERAGFGNGHDAAGDHESLARALELQGRAGEGEIHLRRAVEITRRERGDLHPDTARVFLGLSVNLSIQQKFARADAPSRRALAILTRAAPEHPALITALLTRSVVLDRLGRPAEAETYARRALSLALPQSRYRADVARALDGVGNSLTARRRHADAEPFLRRALLLRESVFGNDHFEVVLQRLHLARSWSRLGRHPHERYRLYDGALRQASELTSGGRVDRLSGRDISWEFRDDRLLQIATAWAAAHTADARRAED